MVPSPSFPRIWNGPNGASDMIRILAGPAFGSLADETIYLGPQQLERDLVAAALGDDEVGEPFRGLAERLVHGSNRGEVLLDHGVDRPATLRRVAAEPAYEAHVGVGVDEDPYVAQVADLRHGEDEDPLEDHDLRRVDRDVVVGPRVLGVVVDRTPDRFPLAEPADVLDEELLVEGVRMVVVDLAALVEGEVAPVAVVGVLDEDLDPLRAPMRGERLGDGRLPRARTARDPEDRGHGAGS